MTRYDVQPTIDQYPSTLTAPVVPNYQYDPAAYYNQPTNQTPTYNYQTERTASSLDGHSDQSDVPPVKSSACTIL